MLNANTQLHLDDTKHLLVYLTPDFITNVR